MWNGLLLIVLGGAIALPSTQAFLANFKHHGMTDVCNDYVDQVIQDLKDSKEYFEDPYRIQGKSVALSKKVLFVNYTGEATISDGFIFGLTSLHRDDDVIVDKKKETHLKVYLGAGELKMNCEGKVKLMGHGPNVKVQAKISYINMKVDFVPNSKTGENPKVKNFNIEEVKGAEVDVKGLGPLNIFVKGFVHVMGTFFKRLVRVAIENGIKKAMENKFKNYVIPVECLQS